MDKPGILLIFSLSNHSLFYPHCLSQGRELSLMAVASAAIPAGVNILLRILTCEVNVVARFALGLACRTGVAIGNIEAAREACIPICEEFDDIGVRGPLLLLHATLRGICWHASLRGKVVHIASTTCRWGHHVDRGKHTSHAWGRG